MDTTGCPAGLATDMVFLLVPMGTCNSRLDVYWGVTMSICSIRLCAFIAKLYHVLANDGSIRNWPRRRYPPVIVGATSTISYFAFAILSGTNVASAANGLSFSLFSITYLSFIVDITLMLFKIVRLGKNVIALPRAYMAEKNMEYLTRFSSIGMILVVLQIIMAVVSSLVLIVISPIQPQNDVLLGTLGFATKGIFQVLCTLGIVLQFQRCVRALDLFLKARAASNIADSDSVLARMSMARHTLRQRQLFIFTFGGGAGLMFILLAAFIPWSWEWIVLGIAAPEATGLLVVELVFNRRKKKSAKSGSNRQNDANEKKDVVMSGDSVNNSAYGSSEGRFFSLPSLSLLMTSKKKRNWQMALSRIMEESRATPLSDVDKATMAYSPSSQEI